MPGYEGDADTILNVLGMYPTGNPHDVTEQPHSTTKYEWWDLGAGDHMLSIANPKGSVNILIKISP